MKIPASVKADRIVSGEKAFDAEASNSAMMGGFRWSLLCSSIKR